MSTSTHNVVLKATDGISQVFTKVGHSADAMSAEMVRSLQAIERNTNSMAQGVQRAGATSSQAMQQISRSGAALGASLGTLAGLMSEFARGSEAAAQVHRQLEQAIQNTGESFDLYSAAIERAGKAAVQLGFDDEAAFSALQVLTENTGSAQVALDQLGLAEDLAAAKGMSLESAATLISRVYEGNVGILKRYGIVVAEGATATEALAQVQTQVAGQAEAHASTLARWHEELSNVADAVGGAMGQFAPFVAMLPGLSIGLSAASTVLGGIAPGLSSAGLATSGFTAALGTAGLIGVAGAAVVSLGILGHEFLTYRDSADAAKDATVQLNDILFQMNAGGAGASTVGPFKALIDDFGAFAVAGAKAEDQYIGIIDQLTTATNELVGATSSGNQEMIDAAVAQIASLEGLRDEYDKLRLSGDQIDAMNQDIAASMRKPGVDAALLSAAYEDLFAKFKAGKISADELVSGIDNVSAHWFDYAKALNDGSGATTAAAAAMALQKAAVTELDGTVTKLKGTYLDTAQGQEVLSDLTAIYTSNNQAAIMAAQQYQSQLASGAIDLNTYASDIDHISDGLERQARAEDHAAQAAANRVLAQTTAQAAQPFSLPSNLARSQTTAADIAATKEFIAAQQESIYQAALEQEANVGVAGSLGKIFEATQTTVVGENDLLDAWHASETALDRVARGSNSAAVQMAAYGEVQAGLIAQQGPYNQLASEYGSQLSAISAAQDILNQRQAEGQTLTKDQIDFLNGAADAQANLTSGQEEATIQAGILAEKYGENLSVGEAMAAAMSDSAGSTKDLTAAVDALIVTLGGIPPDIKTKIEAEDAATDPVGGILDTYGKIPPDVPTTVTAHDDATTTTDGIIGKYGDVPDDVPTSLTAIDNASSTIGGVRSELDSLDGKTATTYINTVYQQFESVIGHQHGGIVGAMANGGIAFGDPKFAANGRMGGSPTWVGEAGPELVNLPYGSTVWPAASSKMSAKGRGEGDGPHFENCSFTIVANNPRQFFDQMKSFQIGDTR